MIYEKAPCVKLQIRNSELLSQQAKSLLGKDEGHVKWV